MSDLLPVAQNINKHINISFLDPFLSSIVNKLSDMFHIFLMHTSFPSGPFSGMHGLNVNCKCNPLLPKVKENEIFSN